ncbi:SGNH/GDSL hydrolase family protein [Dongia sp.]|uniref:SGNH/GDSL hydrolase family protein n=1 Tax=Dongia sp. TaxID=1977262 RepID=UPI0035AED084
MAVSLRTTIIGGSNTVMEPGYLGQMLAATSARGVELDIVENLAVGGTTSAYGLFRLKATDALDRSDLLIIEYALNDAFIYGDERRQFRHWARLYEGILRYALARNPALKICTLVFGARNGSWLTSVPAIDSGIRYLSDWYGTGIVDISRSLMRRFGRQVVSDPAFYVDQGHYARPIATAMVADLAAEGLIDCLNAQKAASIPVPVDPDHFGDAEIIDSTEIFTQADSVPLAEFHNRRFAFSAADLAGHKLSLDIVGGKLLAVFHMSSPDVATLALRRNDTLHHCSLLKGGVRDGKFKFLGAMLPCEFLYGADLLTPTANEHYELSRAVTDPSAKIHLAKDNVATGTPSPTEHLPILGLLHTGTRRSFRVENVTPAPRLRAANSA